jgi:NADH-quinone oxidoreductase subunit A
MKQELMNPYVPVLVLLVFNFIFACIVSGLSFILGPRRYNKSKMETYECGVPMVTSAQEKNSVKFYLTAILFILFDIETVFLFLWARSFKQLGWFGLIEVAIFIAILVAGYVYILKRRALEWD